MVVRKTKGNKKKQKVFIVICIEGDADELMFKRLIDYYQNNGWVPHGDIKYHKTHGFPTESAIQSKLKQIQQSYTNYEIIFNTVLCEYDTDVLVKDTFVAPAWGIVKKNLIRDFHVENFCRIEVKTSIEDWMLDDITGLLKSLRLPSNTKPKGKFGQDKVKDLFLRKNIVYDRNKGEKNIKPIIDKLDIGKIREARKKELREFERLLGVNI